MTDTLPHAGRERDIFSRAELEQAMSHAESLTSARGCSSAKSKRRAATMRLKRLFRLFLDAAQPLRRVPSQSHIQNFSGSQAALQMMDPDAPDPFQGRTRVGRHLLIEHEVTRILRPPP